MASCLLASDAPSRRLLWKNVHAYYGITPLPLLYQVGVNFLICTNDYARILNVVIRPSNDYARNLNVVIRPSNVNIQRFITVIRMQFFIFLSLVYIYLRRFNIFIVYHTLHIWWVLCNNIQAKKLYNSFCIAFDAQFSFRLEISSSHFIVLKFQHVLFWRRKRKWERLVVAVNWAIKIDTFAVQKYFSCISSEFNTYLILSGTDKVCS